MKQSTKIEFLHCEKDTLSEPAKQILKSFELGGNGGKVVAVSEKLDHDGCDSIGYKSDLWDLYVISHKKDANANYILSHYHWENWYNNKADITTEHYTLCFKTPIQNLMLPYYFEIASQMKSDNADFENFMSSFAQI